MDLYKAELLLCIGYSMLKKLHKLLQHSSSVLLELFDQNLIHIHITHLLIGKFVNLLMKKHTSASSILGNASAGSREGNAL